MSCKLKNKTIEEAANILYAQVYALTEYQEQVAAQGNTGLAECLGFTIGLAREAVGKLNTLLEEQPFRGHGEDVASPSSASLADRQYDWLPVVGYGG